ncbi:hypothetical protein ACFE04_022259 [Oxalis oulophora]
MEWTRGPAIGRGSTATVSLATSTVSGDLFAVKSTELSNSLFLRREESILSKSNSPYIVKYLGSDVTNVNGNLMYNLHMEYLPGGTLYESIQRHGGKLEEEAMIRSYARQLLLGVNYLHGIGVVHCDIKSQNIILAGKGAAKIADLGCAKFVIGGPATSAISGTPAFMAPEVARGEEQGFEADIWSVGCTIIEMVTGSNPWPELRDPVSALYTIGFSGKGPEIPFWLSDMAKDFVAKCLINDPRERWSAEELLKHPFVSEDQIIKEMMFIVKNSDSPCSVLNQRIWDSSSEVVMESPYESSSNWTDFAAERIGNLMVSEQPEWGSDEDWITVRAVIEEILVHESNMVYEQEMIDDNNSIYLLLDDQNVVNTSNDDDEFSDERNLKSTLGHHKLLEWVILRDQILVAFTTPIDPSSPTR